MTHAAAGWRCVPVVEVETTSREVHPQQSIGQFFCGGSLESDAELSLDDEYRLAEQNNLGTITCVLGTSWQFEKISEGATNLVANRPSAQVLKHPDLPTYLIRVVIALDSILARYHPKATINSLKNFWSSRQVHAFVQERSELYAAMIHRLTGRELCRVSADQTVDSMRRWLFVYSCEISRTNSDRDSSDDYPAALADPSAYLFEFAISPNRDSAANKAVGPTAKHKHAERIAANLAALKEEARVIGWPLPALASKLRESGLHITERAVASHTASGENRRTPDGRSLKVYASVFSEILGRPIATDWIRTHSLVS